LAQLNLELSSNFRRDQIYNSHRCNFAHTLLPLKSDLDVQNPTSDALVSSPTFWLYLLLHRGRCKPIYFTCKMVGLQMLKMNLSIVLQWKLFAFLAQGTHNFLRTEPILSNVRKLDHFDCCKYFSLLLHGVAFEKEWVNLLRNFFQRQASFFRLNFMSKLSLCYKTFFSSN
jgi:hypothetical protein